MRGRGDYCVCNQKQEKIMDVFFACRMIQDPVMVSTWDLLDEEFSVDG